MTPSQLAVYQIAEARTVQILYVALACIILLIVGAFLVVKLADLRAPRATIRAGSAVSVLRVPSLNRAVAAQFFYVGGQVCIWSFFIDLVKDLQPDTAERTAAYLLSLSLASFMVGRFIGTALLRRTSPRRLLFICADANTMLLAVGLVTQGWTAIAAIGLTSLFMSIQFPTIFTFGLRDLGDRAMVGSSFLVMAIVGGAFIPPLMGLIDHLTGSLHPSLIVPLACFGLVALYAARLPRRAASTSATQEMHATVVQESTATCRKTHAI